MAEMRQSPAERAALKAKWDSQPLVVQMRAEGAAFAREHNLKFDIDGMNAMNEFSDRFIAEHGALPPTGILVG